ncbi:MAG TPA: quinone-dependent dihydroorotate dehydrogenase [Trueperaceae bacterium]|nr:quinone-dependent dihydroorotate dehydrogenase [Trueperaceae bacterium]
MNFYPIVKRALFELEPERAHHLVMSGLALASRTVTLPRLLGLLAPASDPRLAVDAFGLRFPNPLGLAAGLDKNGVAFPALAAMGFGAVELGSVTALPQPGNPRPRLFRLIEDEALINRMGFNNAGATAIAERLAALRRGASGAVLGVNVGKSRAASIDGAADDYRAGLTAVWNVADYLVVNVSSPNTPGLRTLQRTEPLVELLRVVNDLRGSLGHKPVLVKLAPDLDGAELADLVDAAGGAGATGLVATNTTLARDGLTSAHRSEEGGLSGKPLAGRAMRVLEQIRERTALPVVAVGGIWSSQDAIARLEAGADLLQLYTAFIYRGPEVVREILTGISAELDRRGLNSVTDLRQPR